MTKEQEKAVEICKSLKRCLSMYSDEEDNVESGKAIETVLNMLKEQEKQEKQIEKDRELKRRLCKEVNQVYEEVETLEKILNQIKEECKKQIQENEDSILELFPQKILEIIDKKTANHKSNENKIIEIYAIKNKDEVSYKFIKTDDSELANDTIKYLISLIFENQIKTDKKSEEKSDNSKKIENIKKEIDELNESLEELKRTQISILGADR